jgi:serine/threonine protein kinase
MLGPFGETLVVDWGLAKVVGRQHGDKLSPDGAEATLRPSAGSSVVETVAGAAVGTPAYMSPEQAEGKIDALGPATDIYSLGGTLYSLLSGKSPIQGESAQEVLEKVRQGRWGVPGVGSGSFLRLPGDAMLDFLEESDEIDAVSQRLKCALAP